MVFLNDVYVFVYIISLNFLVGKNQALFNNAAQSFNHEFYWKCMKPNGGGKPAGRIAKLIDSSFGDFEKFRAEFVNAGLTAFGSGWAWLVWTPSGLKVTKTIGADTPLTEAGSVPLLTMDVWVIITLRHYFDF
jgi:superoxide dismutase, Fe-Mn family